MLNAIYRWVNDYHHRWTGGSQVNFRRSQASLCKFVIDRIGSMYTSIYTSPSSYIEKKKKEKERKKRLQIHETEMRGRGYYCYIKASGDPDGYVEVSKTNLDETRARTKARKSCPSHRDLVYLALFTPGNFRIKTQGNARVVGLKEFVARICACRS